MSDNKKYYYLKLKDNFFDSEEMKVFENSNYYDEIVISYIKLLCKSDFYKRGYRIIKHKNIDSLILIDIYLSNLKELKNIVITNLKIYNLIEIRKFEIIIKDINIDLERNRASKEYINWRNNVFKRDNYSCQFCSISGCKLHAHHIEYWSINKEKRYDINNGITLCIKCHKNLHKEDKNG